MFDICVYTFQPTPNLNALKLKEEGNRPIDDLFILSSDEVLLLGCDDAQGVLLARLGLSINDVCTEVHVHGALWQRAWLQEKHDKHHHYFTHPFD